jgi:hypothetical protein
MKTHYAELRSLFAWWRVLKQLIRILCTYPGSTVSHFLVLCQALFQALLDLSRLRLWQELELELNLELELAAQVGLSYLRSRCQNAAQVRWGQLARGSSHRHHRCIPSISSPELMHSRLL